MLSSAVDALVESHVLNWQRKKGAAALTLARRQERGSI